MKFRNIYIEETALENPITKRLVERQKVSFQIIKNLDDFFAKVKKPYLHKRDSLDLFIGTKKGTLIKFAPPAYGLLRGSVHFFFIHQYNCIYECEYCYLQGYFASPDLVIYVNHDDIIADMEQKFLQYKNQYQKVWFHAGEYSDSLALNHLTAEWELYLPLLQKYSSLYLELRTKSANIGELLKFKQTVTGGIPKNFIVSFSLAPQLNVARYDRKTVSLSARIRAIRKLAEAGFQIGIHFDPIIYYPGVLKDYQELIAQILQVLPQSQLEYVSLGVVRFTKTVYLEVKRNYPQSTFHFGEFVKSFDGKVRYNLPLRQKILFSIRKMWLDAQTFHEKIYLCMEEDEQEA